MHQERRWRKLPEEGAETLKGGAGRPHLAASGHPALQVSSKVFPRPVRDLFVADKFHVYFTLESLFSSFSKNGP